MAGLLDDYDIQREAIRQGLLSEAPETGAQYGLLSDAPVYRRGTPGQMRRVVDGTEAGMQYQPGSPTMDAIRQWARENPLDAGALALAPVPVVGDVAGLANDLRHYATDPKSRTIGNYALTGLGLLPFVPSAFGMVKNVGKGPDSGYNLTPSGVRSNVGPEPSAAPGANRLGARETLEEIPLRPALPEREADILAGRGGVGVDRLSGGGVGKTALDQFGNPMLAKHVIGRRHDGGPDVPLDIDAARDLAGLLTGDRVYVAPRSNPNLRGDDGRVTKPKRPGEDPLLEMYIAKGMDAENTLGTFRHENGHAIKLRGGISDGARPPPGIDRAAVDAEMEALSRQIRPNLWASDVPKLQKYRQQGDELFADSVQAYSADPARIREQYPSFAAYLQWMGNDNPLLKRYVQFNELGAGLGAAGIGAGALGASLLSGGEAQAAPATLEELMAASR